MPLQDEKEKSQGLTKRNVNSCEKTKKNIRETRYCDMYLHVLYYEKGEAHYIK